MPVVSICLPVFNGEKYLAAALESVLAQTCDDFELLIADDCSEDGSCDIINRFAKQDRRIKTWRNDSNLGLFLNYNACISRASGKYIKLFAQDDLFHRELVEKQVIVLDANPSVSLVASARTPIDADGNTISLQSPREAKWVKPYSQSKLLNSRDVISEVLRDGINWLGEPCSQMYRAEYRGTGFDTSYKQLGDLEYAFRLLQNGNYFFISDALCSFRKHPGSSSAMAALDMSAHLEWVLLSAKYREYLSLVNLTPEEYCLRLIEAWTRDLECDMNASERLDWQGRASILCELYGRADILAPFIREKDQPRNQMEEFRILGAMALLESAILEHELRTVHDEIARPYSEVDPAEISMSFVRPGIVAALNGLKETLRERDKEIVNLRAKLDDIGQSVSWKLTEPIRILRRRINRY